MSQQPRVLFVCMGNICRSPTAQGVFEHVIADTPLRDAEVDSAGTHAYHAGEPPDGRSQEAAKRRGIDLSAQRARKVVPADFEHYNYVLAMDSDNHQMLMAQCPPEYRERVRLFLEFAPERNVRDVPDPYYGGRDGFETVLDLVEAASRGLCAHLLKRA